MATLREVAEEVGVDVEPSDLEYGHVAHHRNAQGETRIGFLFTARQ
ncbi:NUDIX hydrolase [Streptomonospora litoralis]|nr:hypothetical protein [Streptomonospora litoralis]